MNNENKDNNAIRAEICADNNQAAECGKDKRPKSAEELTAALAQFTGTVEYHRYWLGIALQTDGVKYLADKARCYWLLDAIGSYQSELAKHKDQRLQEMQFWTLRVNTDKSAVLTCVADYGEPPVITQDIEWTDFPLPEIQIWIGGEDKTKIALLPSEY